MYDNVAQRLWIFDSKLHLRTGPNPSELNPLPAIIILVHNKLSLIVIKFFALFSDIRNHKKPNQLEFYF